MGRIERFHPGTKVIEWLSGSLSALPVSATGAGYFAGGLAGGSYADSIEKLLFGSETCALTSATLSVAMSQKGAMSNNGTAGYIAGGQSSAEGHSSPSSIVDKLTYSGESRSTLGTGLSVGRDEQPAGVANSGTAGYFGGGNENGSWSEGSYVIDKYAFSNDSRSVVSDGLSVQVRAPGAMANSGTAGYWAAGYKYAPGSTDHIDKMTFSNDSRSTISATVHNDTWACCGFANSGTAGYFMGGGWGNNWDRIQFSNDTKSLLWPSQAWAAQLGGGASDNGVAGYFTGGNRANGGGFTGADEGYPDHTHVKEIIKLPYSTEVQSILTATLVSGRDNLCNGFANCAGSL